MPMKTATALSLSIIPILSTAPLLRYITGTPSVLVGNSQTGFLVWPYIIPIAIMVAIFANFGLRAAKHIPVIYLRITFASLATIFLIKTAFEIFNK